MNIPNSPDELLREYHKNPREKKKCDCKVCTAMRTLEGMDLSVYEAVLIQGMIGQATMDGLFNATRILMDQRDFAGSMAMSHLAGQITIVLAGIQGCLRTIKAVNEMEEL